MEEEKPGQSGLDAIRALASDPSMIEDSSYEPDVEDDRSDNELYDGTGRFRAGVDPFFIEPMSKEARDKYDKALKLRAADKALISEKVQGVFLKNDQ